jgi:hypothetical protein
MLRFILIVMLLIVIVKVSQDNPYIGFGMYFALSAGFMIYTLNIVDKDEIELRIKKSKIRGRSHDKYDIINSQ